MGRLEQKRILVCGGATGIGAETARLLCEQGARVAIGDINLQAAGATANACADAVAIHFDQADEPSINALVERAADHLQGLDGLVANVADLQTVLHDGDILSNDAAIWHRTFQVNLTGTALLIRAALPHLLEQRGAIVCTSSGAAAIGEDQRPAYAASKAGVNAICRHIASRFGKQGVRANAIAPGLIVTGQVEQGLGREFLDKILREVNAPRHGAPTDIAAAIAFLLSDEAAWVNGQTWHVNGGVYYGD